VCVMSTGGAEQQQAPAAPSPEGEGTSAACAVLALSTLCFLALRPTCCRLTGKEKPDGKRIGRRALRR